MPGIVRKLLLIAAADGLILQPLTQRNTRAPAAIKIDYAKHDIRPLLEDQSKHGASARSSIEVWGVIGLLRIASNAYLISISRRKQVAYLWGKPIYVITGVAIIPLGSQDDASRAIEEARAESSAAGAVDDDSDVSGEDHFNGEDSDTLSISEDTSLGSDKDPSARPSLEQGGRTPSGQLRQPGIVENVIKSKGLYGRFADRWFSRRGLDANVVPAAAATFEVKPVSSSVGPDPTNSGEAGCQQWPQTPSTERTLDEASSRSLDKNVASSLAPKLLQTTKALMQSRTFHFSYDLDITRSLITQQPKGADLLMSKQVKEEYYWNEHLQQPFADAGFHEYMVPVMQGFVGQRSFALEALGHESAKAIDCQAEVDSSEKATPAAVRPSDEHSSTAAKSQDFIITLISRRSARRSGLRYLRRGVDEDGNVANAVETEQLLSGASPDSATKVYSFVQSRGSIPLYFSQMPYTFKPPPSLHGSPEANQAALRKHFSELISRYGDLQAVSLIDRHGPELAIGEAYESSVKELNAIGGVNNHMVGFEWFEFHNACRGMKFENVSQLVDSMTSFLDSSSFSVLKDSKLLHTQSGIIRTNCMDCLDRTNVVQSALAQRTLSEQLAEEGLVVDLVSDSSTIWFNSLWADNGDAISRAYTGTSALKGDYTRTRKRSTFGALTDLSLTLTRYYHNLFDDFFAQALIDYLLGSVNEAVFLEFQEQMTTADPAFDMQRARQTAIDTASSIVVEEHEDLMHGWVLSVPAVSGTLRTFPFSEALLLLTQAAVYAVSFDWNASKPRSFERIPLHSVTGLQQGTYVTETNTYSQTDPARNVGLILRYKATMPDDGPSPMIRVNTRSIDNMVKDAWSVTGTDGMGDRSPTSPASDIRTLAFKALSTRLTSTRSSKGPSKQLTEEATVKDICHELEMAVNDAKNRGERDHHIFVETRDIVSVQDAKRSAGYIESIAYQVKKAIWG